MKIFRTKKRMDVLCRNRCFENLKQTGNKLMNILAKSLNNNHEGFLPVTLPKK